MTEIFLVYFITLILMFFLIFNQKKISYKLNLIDYPENIRKKHKSPTPVSGGLILFFSLLLPIFYFFNLFFESDKFLISFVLFYILVFIIGLYDDIYDVKPITKLMLSGFIAIFFLTLNQDLATNTFRFNFLNLSFVISDGASLIFLGLCFVLLQNSLNMADGINGIFIGISIVFLIILSFYQNVSFLSFLILLILMLSILLFLNLNSKLFMGDGGVFLLTVIFFVLILKTYQTNYNFKCDNIFLMLMIPGVDMFRMFLERILKNINPFSPSLNHFHHKLSAKFGTNIALFIYLSLILIPNLMYFLVHQVEYLILITFLIYLGLLRFCINDKYQ